MLLDKKPDGTYSKDEKYYLLSDVISEDKTLRFELQQNRLVSILLLFFYLRIFDRNMNKFGK